MAAAQQDKAGAEAPTEMAGGDDIHCSPAWGGTHSPGSRKLFLHSTFYCQQQAIQRQARLLEAGSAGC